MRGTTRRLALDALLTALALALSYVEGAFLPPLPLPGVKLGLANVATVFALEALGAGDALRILLSRCLLGALFAGNASALLFSLLGGLCALAAMLLLRRAGHLSLFGVSIGGAAAHNCGQIAAAMLALGNRAPLHYLPFLLLVSLVSGALTGLLTSLLLSALEKAEPGKEHHHG